MHQLCSDRTINTTTNCSNYATLWTTNISDPHDFLADEFFLNIGHDEVLIRDLYAQTNKKKNTIVQWGLH